MVRQVQFQYDTAGRLSLLGLVSGDRSYNYDAASRLTSLNTPVLSMGYSYDGRLLTGSTWSGAIAGSVTRTFDNDFRISSDSVNGTPAIAVLYDADSLRTQVGALSLTRSAQTGLITATALGALSDSRSFDTFGDPSQYSASRSGSAVYALDLSRDALGRITSKIETLGGATHVFSYTYDLAGRLSDVRQDGLLTDSYTYDANGNRLTGPQATIIYTYDDQDRLTQRSGVGTQAYSYTPNGERQNKTLAGQTTTYRYDSLGLLSGVSFPGGTQIDYVLDGSGRRVGKQVNGALAQGFLYQDGLHPIAELDGAGNLISRFVYAGGNAPAYLSKGGATYRIITDQLGSPRVVVDIATGQIAQRLDYDPFGVVTFDTNPGFQPFGFAGGLYDPQTGLVHFGVREYDPETGRWITKDPIGFAGGATNFYAYVGNDPVNNVDPTGLIDTLTTGLGRMCAVDPVACAEVAGAVATAGGAAAAVAPEAEPALVAAAEEGEAVVGAVEGFICRSGTLADSVVPAAEAPYAAWLRAPVTPDAVEGVAKTAPQIEAETAAAFAETAPGFETAAELGTYTAEQWAWINRMLDLTRDARIEDALSGDPARLERAKSAASSVFRLVRSIVRR